MLSLVVTKNSSLGPYKHQHQIVLMEKPPLLLKCMRFGPAFGLKMRSIVKARQRMEDITFMLFNEMSTQDMTNVLGKFQSWKAPGPDQIHNFWLKKFTCAHEFLR